MASPLEKREPKRACLPRHGLHIVVVYRSRLVLLYTVLKAEALLPVPDGS
jgi:hypothetical protein